MLLSNFIVQHLDTILDEWEVFARQIPSATGMPAVGLRDHARGILLAIADDLEAQQTEDQQEAKGRGLWRRLPAESEAELHGSSRVAEGFSVTEAMAEFRALRASVLRIFAADSCETIPQVMEVTRFNEAIDQALTESLARYTDLKDRQARLLETLLGASPDLHYVVDRMGTLIYCNAAFADIFGKRREQLQGTHFASLCEPLTQAVAAQMFEAAENGGSSGAELHIARKDGSAGVFEQVFVPVRDTLGHCEAIAATARDVTERKAGEERARYQANYDGLTDLPNRGRFLERLDLEIRHAARTGFPLALLFIDLDGFKNVNDQLGHAAGDQLLQQAARRLESCIRDTDVAARLGGDEFTVILTDVTLPPHVATLTMEILDELARPFQLSEAQASISASIGIAMYPGDGDSADELLRNADKAMYRAKEEGRNRYAFFSVLPAMPTSLPPSGAARRH